MIISNDNDSLIFDMHIMMKMIPRYYHSIITQISIKYPNIKSQTNNILSRYFDKPQYCTLVLVFHVWSISDDRNIFRMKSLWFLISDLPGSMPGLEQRSCLGGISAA